jgi:hypothetical protein
MSASALLRSPTRPRRAATFQAAVAAVVGTLRHWAARRSPFRAGGSLRSFRAGRRLAQRALRIWATSCAATFLVAGGGE